MRSFDFGQVVTVLHTGDDFVDEYESEAGTIIEIEDGNPTIYHVEMEDGAVLVLNETEIR